MVDQEKKGLCWSALSIDSASEWKSKTIQNFTEHSSREPISAADIRKNYPQDCIDMTDEEVEEIVGFLHAVAFLAMEEAYKKKI